MPSRRLPPRVLDLQAPQYPLPDAPAPRPASRRRARPGDLAVVVGGGGGGDLSRSTDPLVDRDPTTTTAHGLARAVARYLRVRLGTALAAEMVEEYGAIPILRALPLVMRPHWVEEPVAQLTYAEIKAWRAAGAKGQLRRPGRERILWEPAPGLRSPGGVLRRKLEAGRLTAASRSGYSDQAGGATEPRQQAIGG